MRTTAPLRLATLAALALGAAQVATPAAQAKVTSNGASLNGTSFNGTSFNGANLNGTNLNGTDARGLHADRLATPPPDTNRLRLRAVRLRGD